MSNKLFRKTVSSIAYRVKETKIQV